MLSWIKKHILFSKICMLYALSILGSSILPHFLKHLPEYKGLYYFGVIVLTVLTISCCATATIMTTATIIHKDNDPRW